MMTTSNTVLKKSSGSDPNSYASLDACLTVPPGQPPNVEQIRALLRLLLTANEIVTRTGNPPAHAEQRVDGSDAGAGRARGGQLDIEKLQTLVRHLAWLEAALAARTSIPDVTSPGMHGERTYRPRLELFESPSSNTAVATLELPGMHRSEVQIVMRGNTLVVSGERRARPYEYEGSTTVDELKYGKLTRAIPLPHDIEPSDIRATMEEGMLTVRWPLRPHTMTNITEASPIPVA